MEKLMNKKMPIGVMDAGMGGLTVVKELQKLLPGEDIIFYGEGKYQPYGNRSEDVILHLAKQNIEFLKKQGVKTVVIGCNTISTLIDKYQDNFDFKIFSIVQAGSDMVLDMGIEKVGVLATMFTIESGCYTRLIHARNPKVSVIGQGSVYLARILEDGDFNRERIDNELKLCIDQMLQKEPDLRTMVLGCTHFPMASENILRLYPQFTTLINPAEAQAKQVAEYLKAENAFNDQKKGTFKLYSTTNCETYLSAARRIGCNEPDVVELAPAPVMG